MLDMIPRKIVCFIAVLFILSFIAGCAENKIEEPIPEASGDMQPSPETGGKVNLFRKQVKWGFFHQQKK